LAEIEFYEIIVKELAGGDESIIVERGKFAAARGLGGIYRIFVKLGTPGFIISRATHLTNRYFTEIQGQVRVIAKNNIIVKYFNLKGLGKGYHLFESTILGYCYTACELSGGKNIQAKMAVSSVINNEYFEIALCWS
jgi:hypothetical protein